MVQKEAEKERAIVLRKQGLSYGEILKEVPVSKASLSLWLQDIELSHGQRERLEKKWEVARVKGGIKRHLMRMEEWRLIREKAASEVEKLSKKQRWISGVMLYWAEGAKEKEHGQSTDIKFSNSDPRMLIIFQSWLNEFFNVSKDKPRYELYIHKRADWENAQLFWIKALAIKPGRVQVYFKPHNPNPKRKNVGLQYHGLIRISVPKSIKFVRRIDGWIAGVVNKW